MAKRAIKLFRDAAKAEKAARELMARGYTAEEISILMKDKAVAERFSAGNGPARAEVDIPGVGPTVALGPLAGVLGQAGGSADAVVAALMQELGISPDIYPYYEFGLSLGGIMVSVHAEKERLAEARQVMREIDAETDKERPPIWSHSPGFSKSQRMVETNPVDAKLSGDFRRY